MAFQWQTFRTRALTAIVFAAIMLVGLLWNQWSFLVLFSIIHFGCWWEYFKLTEKINRTSFPIYLKLGLMLVGYGLMLWFCGPGYNVNGYGLRDNISLPVSAAGFGMLIIGVIQNKRTHLKAFVMAFMGLIYISLSWGLMIDLSQFMGGVLNDYPVLLPCVTILCMWVNDTMAYIVGSLIGKTPLSPISPKKTWEGTVGGIILCIGVMGLVGSAMAGDIVFPGLHFHIPAYHWYIIAGIAAVTGTFGDLLESKLKRMAGVKDSGTIMPGHGGFLDRFDSLLLAVPFVWLYVQWI